LTGSHHSGSLARARRRVALVQQGVWDMEKESLPLASAYMKATLDADERIRDAADVRIHNFNGGVTIGTMVRDLLLDRPPDILAFSVFGWNFQQFATLSETYKQINPDGVVVWGGTHVANQADRVFKLAPSVDVIVNAEGEFIFRSIVEAYLAHGKSAEFWTSLHRILGLSVNDPCGEVIDTGDAGRIQDINEIPSPFLTGAVDLLDDRGEFRYDVALLETNRGCPYKCAFCYWGGAVGQKVRSFDRARLRAEVETFARLGVDSLVLCDANFGMLPADVEFVEDVIRIRERYGHPRSIDTSWAKNKSKAFYEIVRRMSETGLRSSFTLALQTLDDRALELMHRRNMRLNDWAEMVEFVHAQGLELYAELLWGAPGESREDFLAGYNRISRHTSRIAAYPLLVLPNTGYFEERDELGIITVRGEADDFEYVLATNELSLQENIESQPFLLLLRTLGEHMILRYTWHALRALCDVDQGSALWAIGEYVRGSSHPVAEELRRVLDGRTVVDSPAVADALRVLYTNDLVEEFLANWLEHDVRPRVEESTWQLISDIFRFDWHSRALMDSEPWLVEPLRTEERDDGTWYVREGVEFSFPLLDVFTAGEASSADALTAALDEGPTTEPRVYDFAYRAGFAEHIDSHEIAAHYFAEVSPTGQPPSDIAGSPDDAAGARERQPARARG
jgi:radical SAM C-methyltransferase